MHITQLKLLGFKSFVEPTELIIRPGLTGVVGPNGCGKSNLLEALRWVMGETSYKAMRGGAMDDVIFSGTQLRPARNIAEVTITIDNKSRSAPAEFNDDETFEIVRSIHRGTGSHYRVNGREVRAKDVKLLFEDAATGARSHALVRQGQIGEIVNSKPQARRRILEDAAGIAGLHSRRHEAELRLSAAEANLERLSDIMGQMDAQLNSLKRQARHALRYKELSQKLRCHEALLLHLKWKAACAGVTKAEEELAIIQEHVGQNTLAETAALTQRENLHSALKPLRGDEAATAAALHRLTLARDGLDQAEQQAKDRETELKASLFNASTDLSRDEHLIKDGEEISARLDVEISALEKNISKLVTDKQEATLHLDQCSMKMMQGEDLFNSLAQSQAENKAKQDSLAADIGRQQSRISHFDLQLGKLTMEKTDLLAKKSKQPQPDLLAAGEPELCTVEALSHEIIRLEKLVADHDQHLPMQETALQKCLTEMQKLRILQNEAALSIRSHETEIFLLEKLLKPKSDNHKPIMDELQTKTGFEQALWAALGEDLEAPFHDKNTEHPPSSFWRSLCVTADGNIPDLPYGTRPLSEFVKSQDTSLQHRLRYIGVIEEADAPSSQGQLQPGQSLVSVSGGLWRWDGFVISPNAPLSAPQRLTERNRLPLLCEELAELTDRQDKLSPELSAIETMVTSHEETVKSTRKEMADLQNRIKQLNQNLRTIEQQNRDIDGRLAAVGEGLLNCQQETDLAEKTIQELQSELSALPLLKTIEINYLAQKEVVSTLRSEHSQAQLNWAGLQREEEMHTKRIAEMKAERLSWVTRADEARSHIGALQKRIEATRYDLEQFSDLPTKFHAQRLALFDEITTAETKRSEAGDALARAETASATHEKELRKLQDDLINTREEKARVETRLEATRSNLLQLIHYIETEMHVKPDGCLKLSGFEAAISLPAMADIEQDITRFKKDRDRLGAVNLRAETEIKEMESQFGTMLTEREDLESAVSKLHKAISQLNDEGRQRLLKAFDEVNGHFKRLFQTLFAGGEAELKLISSDDPLESGLEIIARPPGKKPQVLTLLSGGEKALTAMSLIFAVFLTNPSPICVLDEVDAPLDDSNVDRFCLMIEEMARSTDTRFLVITHHPMTMERMDRLFGVTMSEKGVSQLVSVDLATAEDILETA